MISRAMLLFNIRNNNYEFDKILLEINFIYHLASRGLFKNKRSK